MIHYDKAMTKASDYSWGIYHPGYDAYYPFGYDHPRMAKPHPCFCDRNPQLEAICAELQKRDSRWEIRDTTKKQRDAARVYEGAVV